VTDGDAEHTLAEARTEAPEAGIAVTVEEFPLGDKRIREFGEFGWKLYRDDCCWTPPLMADLFGSWILGVPGLLTADHPYHDFAEVAHFIARRGQEPVGTVSAAVNRRFNDYYDAKVGFFGFFETVDDAEVAGALLDAAAGWLRERGMTVMRGPGQYGCATHERQGVLVEGFDIPPTVELTHNPPYYADLLEAYGMRKAKDYVAYEIDVQAEPDPRLSAVAAKVRERRPGITLRHADLGRLEDEVDLIIEIYNQAWAENWGFLPVTPDEADLLADSLKFIVDPQLVRFAYVDDVPAAVLGALPDPYVALRPRWKWYGDSEWIRLARLAAMRRHIPRVRLMFFGIRPGYRRLGIDAVLFDEMMRYARTRHYTLCEPSMLLEDNELVLRASRFMGGREYKRWRIYEMPL
jgi:GNAT superfamily N-acetyltransferase